MVNIRKIVVMVDETYREMGESISPPTRRAVACAVIDNPCSGRFVKDLTVLTDIGVELGDILTKKCLAALNLPPEQAESFGKAAIVGEGGELEHAAAILHPKMGTPVRAALIKGPALIPSAKKMGGLGTPIDVPLGHKDAAFVRSHFDAIEGRVSDAPRRGEIVVAIAITGSGRPLARIGGLLKHEIKGEDGLR